MARDIAAFQAELNRDAKRAEKRSRGGSNFNFLNPVKPAKIGESARTQLRILPRTNGSGDYENEFWVSVDQHIVTVDGSTKVLVCVDDHDQHGSEKHCPMCNLSRELYKTGDPKCLDAAKDLSTRRRVFVNAIDMGNPEQHLQGEPWAYVWAFSQTVHNGLMDICVAKRAFIDDPENGRDVILSCKRIGAQKRDIRYSVTDLDPSPIPDEYKCVIETAGDLSDMSKSATIEELTEVAAILDPRPGSKRASVSAAAASAPLAPLAPAAAPPPAAPPPIPDSDASTEESVATFHYTGASAEDAVLEVSQIAKLVMADPKGEHFIWTEGMGDWEAAADVAEVKAEIERMRPASPPPKPGGRATPPPPRSPAVGPPKPPKPPGRASF
jgi:hypothetical protein